MTLTSKVLVSCECTHQKEAAFQYFGQVNACTSRSKGLGNILCPEMKNFSHVHICNSALNGSLVYRQMCSKYRQTGTLKYTLVERRVHDCNFYTVKINLLEKDLLCVAKKLAETVGVSPYD